jgi:hypothetical protein
MYVPYMYKRIEALWLLGWGRCQRDKLLLWSPLALRSAPGRGLSPQAVHVAAQRGEEATAQGRTV